MPSNSGEQAGFNGSDNSENLNNLHDVRAEGIKASEVFIAEREKLEAKKAEIEKRLQEIAAEKARIQAEIKQKEARIAEIKAQLGIDLHDDAGSATDSAPTADQGSTTEDDPASPGIDEDDLNIVDDSPNKIRLIDKIRAVIERAKHNPKVKEGLKRAGAFAAIAMVLGGTFIGLNVLSTPKANGTSTEANSPGGASEKDDAYGSYDEYLADVKGGNRTADNENLEAEKGIKDGYGEKGMWLSADKDGDFDFASAREVAEVCGDDEVEMAKYLIDRQSCALTDYICFLPDQLKPEGFQGLNLQETEAKLESLSKDDYESAEQHTKTVMGQAFTRHVIIKGPCENAFMGVEDNGVYLGRSEALAKGIDINHENMKLVACDTIEDNIIVCQFYWLDEDGAEIGNMTVKIIYDEDGNIIGGCMQVVTPEGESTTIYEGIPVIPDNPGTGSEGTGDEGTGSEGTGNEGTGNEGTGNEGTGDEGTGSEGTGDEGTGSEGTGNEGTGNEGTGNEGTGNETTEWGKSGDPHGGDDVDPSDKVNPETEVTKEQNDDTNKGREGDASILPGASSEENGIGEDGFAESGIIAEGADKEEGRLPGGENQATDENGNAEMAGENAYQDQEAIQAGIERDQSGNNAQANATITITPDMTTEQITGAVDEFMDNNPITIHPKAGNDNLTDEQEESIVEQGGF